MLRFSLRSFWAAITVFVVALGLSVFVVRKSQELSIETEIMSNLANISRALQGHVLYSKQGKLPPASVAGSGGKFLSSWRLQIYSHVESSLTKYDTRLPWNSPTNRVLANTFCSAYCLDSGSGDSKNTKYFAIAGKGTAFDTSNPVQTISFDGDLVLVIEVADSGVHWMQPGDYEVEELLACDGQLSDCVDAIMPDRVHVLFADGEVWSLSGNTPMEQFKHFLTLEGSRSYSREEQLGEYCYLKWKSKGITEREISTYE